MPAEQGGRNPPPTKQRAKTCAAGDAGERGDRQTADGGLAVGLGVGGGSVFLASGTGGFAFHTSTRCGDSHGPSKVRPKHWVGLTDWLAVTSVHASTSGTTASRQFATLSRAPSGPPPALPQGSKNTM